MYVCVCVCVCVEREKIWTERKRNSEWGYDNLYLVIILRKRIEIT